MASSRIDVRVDGKDNTSSAFNSVAKNISKLNAESGKAGSTIGNAIGKGAQTASSSIGKLGTTASSAFQKVASGASSAGKSISSAFDGISGALAGLTAGYGALEIAQSAWSGAVQQDFNKQFLATKVGTEAANNYVKSIQDIVAVVPGPDSWMNNLLSGAVAKQTNLSSAELKTLADMSASYYLTATGMGKSAIETQNDLNEYIKTGNTSQLERDSILKDQLPLLEDQATVSDRIKALQAAMVADGYDQVSNLDTLGNKWETVSGLIGKAATSLGNAVAPAVASILDFMMDLDTTTSGVSTTIGLIGVGLVGIVGTAGALSGPLTGAAKAIKAMGSGMVTVAKNIGSAIAKLWEYVVAAKAADKADDGVGTSTGGGNRSTIVSGAAGLVGLSAVIYAGAQAMDAFNYASSATNDTFVKLSTTVDAFGQNLPLPALIAFFTGTDTSSENMYNKQRDQIAGWKAGWAGLTGYLKGAWGNTVSYLSGWWRGFSGYLQSSINGAGAWFGGMGTRIKQLWGETVSYLQGAWNNTVTFFTTGASRAASGVIGAWNWIQSGATGAISTIGGAWGNLVNWVGQGVSGTVHILSDGLYAVWDAVRGLYNTVREGAKGVVSIVQQVIGGPGGPAPRGPGGPESGMSFNYENYGGWQKNAWTGANSMSGNCADMTTGLIARFGGSMVSGTWNGNPHVWWRRPDGTEFDPARKALNGTGSPPPRGPNTSASGNVVVIQGDVYGFKDFQRKVEQANNKIFRGRI